MSGGPTNHEWLALLTAGLYQKTYSSPARTTAKNRVVLDSSFPKERVEKEQMLQITREFNSHIDCSRISRIGLDRIFELFVRSRLLAPSAQAAGRPGRLEARLARRSQLLAQGI